ncbi:hypothetical protein FALCPG4_018510 [Fusarium falciforme]
MPTDLCSTTMKTLNLVGASIDDLQAALSSGSLTSVELVALYIRRVARYDCHGLALNSIPILSQHVFEEAAASDDRRGNEQPVGRLEGIPYTVKDSYKVKGMPVASGSPAFKDLIANEDAFTVSAIRAEGASSSVVLICCRWHTAECSEASMDVPRAHIIPDAWPPPGHLVPPTGPTAELFQSISEDVPPKDRRIAVPSMYIGGPAPHGAMPVFTSDDVTQLWQHVQRELEALGAEFVVVPDFPAVTGYENPSSLPEGSARLPDDWNWYERGPMVAHGWESFLRDNADPKLTSLSCVDQFNIFPHSMRTPVELKHVPASNSIHWGKLFSYTRETPMFETKNLETAVNALEAMRKQLVDDYLDKYKCDFFVFPCQGDVAATDSDIDPDAAAHAWKNGIWYSHGNRAFRHLGIPSMTVPMGIMINKQMPVGLTFAGRAYDDADLLRWANAFEKRTRLRIEPPHTPALDTDVIQLKGAPAALSRQARPRLNVETCEASPNGADNLLVMIQGTLEVVEDVLGAVSPVVEVTVNGKDIPSEQIHIASHSNMASFEVTASISRPTAREAREQTMEPVARDKTMVVVLARAAVGGRPSGFLRLV